MVTPVVDASRDGFDQFAISDERDPSWTQHSQNFRVGDLTGGSFRHENYVCEILTEMDRRYRTGIYRDSNG